MRRECNSKKTQRFVQPFTQEALRSDTQVIPPQKLRAAPPFGPSYSFRYLLERDDILTKLPMVNERLSREKLQIFQKSPKTRENCNFYLQYLPIFFDGLRDCMEYYRTVAQNGLKCLIILTRPKIFTIIPSLISPIRRALATRKQEVIVTTLRAIQWIVKSGPCCGEILLRYHKTFLPLLNSYCCTKINIHDHIDTKCDIGNTVQETLEILEQYSGDKRLAYLSIKRLIPTYESSYFNSNQ